MDFKKLLVVGLVYLQSTVGLSYSINTGPYNFVFPPTAGTATYVLATDGTGVTDWVPPGAALSLPLVLSETLDPANASSSRVSSTTDINSAADSSGANINELKLYTTLLGSQPVGNLVSVRLQNDVSGSSTPNVSGLISAAQNLGNGVDVITVPQAYGIQSGVEVAATTTLSNYSFIQGGVTAFAGSAVGETSFVRDVSFINHLTQGYIGYEDRANVGTVENNWFSFAANNTATHLKGNNQAFNVTDTVTTVDGTTLGFNFAPVVTTSNGNVVGYTDVSQVANMPTVNTGYTSIGLGPTIATGGGTKVYGYSGISNHPNMGHVVFDYIGWEEGGQAAQVDRNVNLLSIHPHVTSVGDNHNTYVDSTHVNSVLSGSFSDLSIYPLVDSVAFNYNGIIVRPNVTEAALATNDFTFTAVADVAGSLAGKGFDFSVPFTNGGQSYSPWYKVSGTGAAPGCCGTPVEVDISTGDSAATIAAATAAALVALGAPFTGYITVTASGDDIHFVAVAQGAATLAADNNTGFTLAYASHGAGDGTAVGLKLDMNNASGFGTNHALEIASGDISAQTVYPLRTLANATAVNQFATNFTAAASATITGADNFGVAPTTFIQLGHDASVSSGAFGVGTTAMGGLNLMQLDNASTIADVAGAFTAFVPIGGTGSGGVVGMVHGYEVAGIPGSATGSPTLMTSAKAFEARAPAGPFTTSTAWGLYAEAGYGQNFMGGKLKVGAGGDTAGTSTVEVNGVVESTSGGFKFPDATVQTTAATATTPGSTNGAVQFNNSGAFGGNASQLFWDAGTSSLGVGTNVTGSSQVYIDSAWTAADDIVGLTIGRSDASNFMDFIPSKLGTRSAIVANTDMELGTGGYMSFSVTGGEKMRMLSSGKFGIGTATPSARLSVEESPAVNGSAPILGRFMNNGDVGGRIRLGLNDTAGGFFTDIQHAYGDGLSFIGGASGTSTVFRIRTDATADFYGDRINLLGGGNNTLFSASGGGSLFTIQMPGDIIINQYDTSFAERVRFKSNGSVGIGTASPATKLDVNGNVNITDVGGTGGNVPHTCHTVSGSAGTATVACAAGEIAMGGGVDCGSTALFLSSSTSTGSPATAWTGSCTSLLNVVTNTSILVRTNCCAY